MALDLVLHPFLYFSYFFVYFLSISSSSVIASPFNIFATSSIFSSLNSSPLNIPSLDMKNGMKKMENNHNPFYLAKMQNQEKVKEIYRKRYLYSDARECIFESKRTKSTLYGL